MNRKPDIIKRAQYRQLLCNINRLEVTGVGVLPVETSPQLEGMGGVLMNKGCQGQ